MAPAFQGDDGRAGVDKIGVGRGWNDASFNLNETRINGVKSANSIRRAFINTTWLIKQYRGRGRRWKEVEGSGSRKGLSGERQMFVASTKLLNVVSCSPHFETGIVVNKFFLFLRRTYSSFLPIFFTFPILDVTANPQLLILIKLLPQNIPILIQKY